MKRILLLFSVVVLCLILSSCSDKNISDTPPENSESETEKTLQTEEVTDNTSDSLPDAVAYYSDLYSAKTVFQDRFNSLKYILVGESNIVELIAVEGLNQTTVISRDNVERVENKESIGFNEVFIYDKTNQNISVYLDSENTKTLLKAIESMD